MFSIEEAFSILVKNLPKPQKTSLDLYNLNTHVLAKNIYSPINMPPFRQSAMDGYALCLHDSLEFKVIGTIKAGDPFAINLQPGEAVKIFTGATVPDSAQAIIQIEKTRLVNSVLKIEESVKEGINIRSVGEQISIGNLALKKGIIINPAGLGFLASLGIKKAVVYKKPKIGVVVTGNELEKVGNVLSFGKVYESNGIMLDAALKSYSFNEIVLYEVDDDFENTKLKLEKALLENDVVLISGGISVGDYDFVARALKDIGVETLFYKVNQKPGKPLYAGKIDRKIVFALPGNPAACLTCFYIYVLPTLLKISGNTLKYKQTIKIKLKHDYFVNSLRPQFLKAIVKNNKVSVLEYQASSMLNSFSIANGLIYLESGNYKIDKGKRVKVYLLKV